MADPTISLALAPWEWAQIRTALALLGEGAAPVDDKVRRGIERWLDRQTVDVEALREATRAAVADADEDRAYLEQLNALYYTGP